MRSRVKYTEQGRDIKEEKQSETCKREAFTGAQSNMSQTAERNICRADERFPWVRQ